MKKSIRIGSGVLVFCAVIALCAVPVQAKSSDKTAADQGITRSLSDDELEKLLDFVKDKWDAGELGSEEQIRDAIEEGEAQFGVKLEDSARDHIADAMEKLDSLGINHDTAISLAGKLYREYGDAISENVEELIGQYGEALADNVGKIIGEQVLEPAKETARAVVEDTAKNFWTDLKNSVFSFFRNIFS